MLFGYHLTPSSLSYGMGGDGLGCVVIGEDEYDIRALGGIGDGDAVARAAVLRRCGGRQYDKANGDQAKHAHPSGDPMP